MITHGKLSRPRWLPILTAVLLAVTALPSYQTVAQGDSRRFPETGKTVKGKFLQYWNVNGGLAQQGFPISEEMQEKSDTDGKTYTVQYFERAVFELHPENVGKPSEVLLSLLGVFQYRQKYPNGAPGQTANTTAGSRLFPETGRRVGGIFLQYWNAKGDLAQQGYPISDEFNEVSPLDGKTYTVQFFERAVFEFHPEEKPEFQVLLSQLGTFQYARKYQQPTAVPATPTTVPATSVPATPVPPTAVPNTPVPTANNPCSGVPNSKDMLIVVLDTNGRVLRESNCEKGGVLLAFLGSDFVPEEPIGGFFTRPDGRVLGTFQGTADTDGNYQVILDTDPSFEPGIWATTIQGSWSNNLAIGYFRILP